MLTTPRGLRWAAACVLVAMLALTPGVRAHAAGLRPVRIGAMPKLPPGAQALGSLPQSTPISATVILQPSDSAGLAAYAQAVSTPGSSLYHQYLTVAEFAQRFGPTSTQIQAVRSAMSTQGLQPGAVSANGLSFPVTAPAATAASAFSTSFERYRLANGSTGFANTQAPSLESNVAPLVQGIAGLDTLAIPQPIDLQASVTGATVPAGPSATVAGAPQPCAAASAGGVYTANQIASAYRFSNLYAAGDLGAGVTVALYELEPYSATDVASYQSCYGTHAAVTPVKVGNGAGTGSGSGEAALDIEDVIGLAPKTSIHVYEGPDTAGGAYATLAQIVTDNTAEVVSTSWGVCEASVGASTEEAEAALFQEAEIQGQSVFAASGDSGADDCANGTPAVDDPASQPYVTGVGGTSLPSSVPPAAETVWNSNGHAGGGGVSSQWALPTYQTAAAVPQSATACPVSSSCREVPDVSADADPATGYAIYYSGHWHAFGGTSAAAPTWAALAALADASPTCAGARVGFANPALYEAAADGYSGNFDDVTSGNNSFGTVTGFSAGPGYDMASGLGTPVGSALAPALCGDQVTVGSPPPQSSATATSQSLQLDATSSAHTTVTYGAAGLPPGLLINPSTGVISGSPTTPGTWAVSASATDASGSAGDADFTWVITGRAVPTIATGTASGGSPPAPAPATSVTLTRPKNQAGRIGAAERLQIKGRDSGALPLTYRATRLPAGLSINARTGLISGKPTKPAQATVSVRVTDSRRSSAATVFRWTVVGRPRVTASSLQRVRGGRARLSLSLSAGTFAATIRRIVIVAPAGTIRFSGRPRRRAPGVSAATKSGRRLKATGQLLRGALAVSLARAGPRGATLRVSVAEISLAPALAARIGRRRSRPLKLTVIVTDARNVRTRLLVAVRGA
jgi:Pro-kumamolisin, activation domain/Putative Ig domain